ncbi:PREDICTED: chymotrypsin-2-like [Drosophila arizonae]|uniref:trypsin n=1 Tax=Drosophila arizonae TaxID=7263 RepID=A0ABM1P248_DROAR|nr:PREDICTED: chymotrypsin-2-like [Drosophila arizonae]
MSLMLMLMIHIVLFYPLTSVNAALGNDTVKIINGFSCDIKETPYQVSLRYAARERRRWGSGHYCGGTIVSNRAIITAAHCLRGRQKEVVVVVGNTFLDDRSATTKELEILSWRIHQKYTKPFNDIALIFTVEYIEPISGAIEILPLNTREVDAGTRCLASGWGRSNHFVPAPTNDLRAQWIQIVSPRICRKLYRIPKVICAGDASTTGPSYGDSGGPLKCDNELSGIVSVGRLVGGPTAYTSIRDFYPWIRHELRNFNGAPPLRPSCIQRQIGLVITIYMVTK